MQRRRTAIGRRIINIQVCVGSSCFLRGAPQVIAAFEGLIEKHRLGDSVVLKGTFCQELCTLGVTVRIGEKVFTGVKSADVPRLFDEEVLKSPGGGT